MQEELILKPKIEYDIDNLDLDYTKLSASQEFGEKLESFNERYEAELVATKTARLGDPFTIGINYTVNVASNSVGFNPSLGSVETSIILDEDLA